MSAPRVRNRIVHASLAVALALGFVGVTAAPAQAVTATVTDEASLRAAIEDASVDVIEFDPDNFGARVIDLTADLPPIQKDVEIIGNAWTVNGNDGDGDGRDYRGFEVADQTVTFTGLRIEGMLDWAIRVSGSEPDVTITDSELWRNTVGVELECSSSRVTVKDSEFTLNSDAINSIGCDTTLSVTGTEFNNNTTALYGFLFGVMTFTDVEVRGNAWGITGTAGGVALTITDSYLSTSLAALRFTSQGGGTVNVEDSIIERSGTALEYEDKGFGAAPDFTFTDTLFNDNAYGITALPGLRGLTGDISLIRSTFLHHNSMFTAAGRSLGEEGGLASLAGDLLVEDSYFERNGVGAGDTGKSFNLQFDSNIDIVNSTFVDDSQQTLNLRGTSPTAKATIVNSTFSGATGEHAINMWGDGQLDLRHSTVTDNAAASGAVRVAGDVEARITHTVISGNAASDLSLEETATGNVDWSILGGVADTSTGGGYVAGEGVAMGVTDPMLAPLADNGGPVLTNGVPIPTHLPLPGSPALNAGNPLITDAPEFDQRGSARISGGTIDIGSVEVLAPVVPVSPTITDPVDATVVSGEMATFSVSATGVPTPAVEWEVSTDAGVTWGLITDPAMTVSPDGLSLSVVTSDMFDGYQYRVTAENSEGVDESEPGLLTVTPVPVSPTITDPADSSVVSGDTATFSVTADGYPVPVVEWEVSTDGGVTWGSVTDSAMTVSPDGLTLSVVTSDMFDGYQFRASAENSEGVDESEPGLLTVTPVPVSPTITDPVDATVVSGATATFSVTATGVPTPAVEWEVSTDAGVTWGSVTDSAMTVSPDGLSLSVVTSEAFDGYQFRASAENSEGIDESEPGLLTVTPAPVAPTITDPVDATGVSGETATFDASVTGYPAPTMTWEVSMDGGVSWGAISDDSAATVAADDLSVSIVTTDAHDGYQYRVTAENSEGVDESEPGLLTVTPAPVSPTITDPADSTVTSGATATFLVTADGYPVPVVEWEVSTDGGVTWGSITDSAMTVSPDGLTLSVVTSDAFDGYQFRATATAGTAIDTSAPAALTVTPVGSTPGPTPPPTPGGSDPSLTDTGSDSSLADTGIDLPALSGLLGVIVLLLGGGLIAVNLISRRRTNAN